MRKLICLVLCTIMLTSCGNNDNSTPPDTTALTEWLAGKTATAEAYCNRDWNFPYKIDHDDLCFRLFTEAGFDWGGDWTTRKDYQHFELIEYL